MRHRKSGRRLGVTTKRRKAMLRQLVEAVFLHGRIKTTLARAKEVRSIAEKIITLAKKGSLHHRRLAMRTIARKDVVNRIFEVIVLWYKGRPGGYTRIIKLGPRAGDAAPMAFLELVDWVEGEKLEGQHTKLIKVVEEKDKDKKDKDEKDDKKAKSKPKKIKPAKKEDKKHKKEKQKEKKVTKDPEKAKKIAERQAEKNKLKKEKANAREKIKKEKQEEKNKRKADLSKKAKVTKKAAKKVKRVTKKRTTKKTKK